MSSALTVPISFQPQPVPSSSNFAPGSDAEAADVHGLEELVVVLAHEALAAAEKLGLHALELFCDRFRVVRLGSVCRLRQHPHLVDHPRVVKRDTLLGAERGLCFLRFRRGGVSDAFRNLEDVVRQPGLLDRSWAAGAASVIGVPVYLQAGVCGGLQQEREVLSPVAGDDAVGAGDLDLGDIGREISDFQQRMNSSPTISTSGRFSFSIALVVAHNDWPNE